MCREVGPEVRCGRSERRLPPSPTWGLPLCAHCARWGPSLRCCSRELARGSYDTCGRGYGGMAMPWGCGAGGTTSSFGRGCGARGRDGDDAAGGGAGPAPGGPRLGFESALCPSLPLTVPGLRVLSGARDGGTSPTPSLYIALQCGLGSLTAWAPETRSPGRGEEGVGRARGILAGRGGLKWSGDRRVGVGAWQGGFLVEPLPSCMSLPNAGLALPGTQTRFSQEPADQTVVAGQRAVLPCVLVNYSGIVQWTKDGLALGMGQGLKGEWAARWPSNDCSVSVPVPQHRLLGLAPLPSPSPCSL